MTFKPSLMVATGWLRVKITTRSCIICSRLTCIARTRSLLAARADVHARIGDSASPLETSLDEMHGLLWLSRDIVIEHWTKQYLALEQAAVSVPLNL